MGTENDFRDDFKAVCPGGHAGIGTFLVVSVHFLKKLVKDHEAILIELRNKAHQTRLLRTALQQKEFGTRCRA